MPGPRAGGQPDVSADVRAGYDGAMAQAPPGTLVAHVDRVLLSVPADSAYRPALRLLLGGLGSGARLSYEQVNELQLAVEALLAHRTVANDKLTIEADVDAGAVELSVGPFVPEDDPGSRLVLARLVRRARIVLHDDGGEWVELATGERVEAEAGR
jgi:hypothetical protein